jgi:hypothetical protein
MREPLRARGYPVPGREEHVRGLTEGEERRAVCHGQESVYAASEGDQVIHVPLERGHEALLGLGEHDMDHARGS